ncbi:Gfo/Idh/MocA family protein [Glycomyces xiaoerkulensis]|uniref:Gfo/Idh/MocA family protein n=1 Tax=Glycomyces xiaoerkulensis TaxID=2038139 RepID=UPI000C2614C7|nr:Gfo/Idh/MocA family oxidoreductase [Glycomyces xiaoerkulensis]
MALTTPLLAVGFGYYLRNGLLTRLLRSEARLVDIEIVTCLLGGTSEFEANVVPLFRSFGLAPPRYVPRLADALKAIGEFADPAAAISTPTGLHFEHAAACIDAGLDVYVERPVVTPADDLPTLVEAADASGLVLFTGNQRRVEPPFQYLHEVVVKRRHFGELAAIRCTLAVGERLSGWRVDKALSGGGIVADTGHHLLDCAAWIADGVGHRFPRGSTRYVGFGREPWMRTGGDPLETSAFGHLRSPRGLNLYFDLSYAVPIGSVYERLEMWDHQGTRVLVMRDQTVRSSQPGLVTHQLGDGSIVSVGVDGTETPLSGRQISRQSNVTGPIEGFLRLHRSSEASVDHPCSGAASVPSWELTKEIHEYVQGCSGA